MINIGDRVIVPNGDLGTITALNEDQSRVRVLLDKHTNLTYHLGNWWLRSQLQSPDDIDQSSRYGNDE